MAEGGRIIKHWPKIVRRQDFGKASGELYKVGHSNLLFLSIGGTSTG